jgi:hypothetical protein
MIHLNTKDLWYDGSTKEFSQEASTLQLPPGTDMEQNIELKSHKTGSVVEFRFKQANRSDTEEDISEWEYVPVESGINISQLTIWND